MDRHDMQRAADDGEAETTRRYLGERRLAVLVTDAVRRADAMSRLDASLRLGTPRNR